MSFDRQEIYAGLLAFVRPIIGVFTGVSYWLLKRYLRHRLRSAIFGAKPLQVQETLTTTKEERKMEKQLIDGKEFDLDMEFKEGKLALISKYEGKGGGAEAKVYVSSDYFFDKLAEKIPGQIDDAIIALLKSAAKAL